MNDNNKYKIGDTNGKWKILDIFKPDKGRKMAHVKCVCGFEKDIILSKLKESLGCFACGRKESAKKRRVKINNGDTIGYWTILDVIKKENNKTIITAKCECGNIKTATNGNIRFFKPCGECCYKIIRSKHIPAPNRTGYMDISGEYFSAIKQNAKRRNIEFDISIEYCWNLFIGQNKKCSIS